MTPHDGAVRIINRYGSRVQVQNGDQLLSTRAFVQPLRYKNKLYLGGNYIPEGYYDGGHSLYIGLPTVRLDQMPFGTQVLFGERRYTVRRADLVYLGDSPLYLWGILQICEEDAYGPI